MGHASPTNRLNKAPRAHQRKPHCLLGSRSYHNASAPAIAAVTTIIHHKAFSSVPTEASTAKGDPCDDRPSPVLRPTVIDGSGPQTGGVGMAVQRAPGFGTQPVRSPHNRPPPGRRRGRRANAAPQRDSRCPPGLEAEVLHSRNRGLVDLWLPTSAIRRGRPNRRCAGGQARAL
jgi:hypothetical protein